MHCGELDRDASCALRRLSCVTWRHGVFSPPDADHNNSHSGLALNTDLSALFGDPYLWLSLPIGVDARPPSAAVVCVSARDMCLSIVICSAAKSWMSVLWGLRTCPPIGWATRSRRESAWFPHHPSEGPESPSPGICGCSRRSRSCSRARFATRSLGLRCLASGGFRSTGDFGCRGLTGVATEASRYSLGRATRARLLWS